MSVLADSSSERMRKNDLSRTSRPEQGAETLAERLAVEMAERWRKGERPLAEEYLNRHPELWDQPEAAADLIYEEICLRQEAGEENPETVLSRFPQWRTQLELLLRFHQVLGPSTPAPNFPTSGETLGEFTLLTELGRGARGRVFLAAQPSLANRLVVLKFVPREGQEHLSLARLQHTHIVPIYSVQEVPGRNLQMLLMPYFGGTTLAQLLAGLADRPPEQRQGKDLLELLDQMQKARGSGVPAGGFARMYLGRASYVDAICWIGALLADALQFAHEHGLVHLDVKPSNILLAAYGQPMLLDFHLAREPIHPDGPLLEWVGGTADYMSPEQEKAMGAVREGRKAELPVDGRSDVYSLGLVLYEALGGKPPPALNAGQAANLSHLGPRPRLEHCNSKVSVGLADIIHKCMAAAPHERYPRAADLAADLRRHLSSLPLQGVRNRSLSERWGKFQKRQPHVLKLAALGVAVFLAIGAFLTISLSNLAASRSQSLALLEQGRNHLQAGQHDAAIEKLTVGLALARDLPLHSTLAKELSDELNLAHVNKRRAEAEKLLEQGKKAYAAGTYDQAFIAFKKGQAYLKDLHDLNQEFSHQLKLTEKTWAAQQLHQFLDQVRFQYGAASQPSAELVKLEMHCRQFWEKRDLLTNIGPALPAALQQQIATDLLDLALLWTHLQVQLSGKDKTAVAGQALEVLKEAEQRFGSSQVLCRERQRHAETLGLTKLATTEKNRAAQLPPQTEWEHYALGMWLLRAGQLKEAADALQQAVHLHPQSLWANFYAGQCAFLLERQEDAVVAFTACIALTPSEEQRAICFFNRALAYTKWERPAQALSDYDWALKLQPSLATAALNRGILHYQQEKFPQAIGDLQYALDNGADKALVYYNLALVYDKKGDHAAALNCARQAVQFNPQQQTACELLNTLQNKKK